MLNTSPNVSIIVPTYARPEPLGKCLQAISALAYPRERLEVVVVDDGSPLSPEPVLRPHRARLQIQLVRQRRGGPAAARNSGAAAANGELLAFTDDDCLPEAGWLDALVTRLAETPEALVFGSTVNGLARNLYASASQLLVTYLCDHFNDDPSTPGSSPATTSPSAPPVSPRSAASIRRTREAQPRIANLPTAGSHRGAG